MKSLVFLALFAIQNGSLDYTYHCQPSRWQGSPRIQNGLYQGTIFSECDVVTHGLGGIAQLDQVILEKIKSNVPAPHSGPNEEIFQDLPSVSFDLTERLQEETGEQDKLYIRSIVHVASDRTNHLIYAGYSRPNGIDATGDSEYLKRFDYFYQVDQVKDSALVPPMFKIKILNTYHVKKPFFAPEGIFYRNVKKSIEKSFSEELPLALDRLAQHL